MAIMIPFYTKAYLNSGDIVIIEYNAADPDQFSFLSLTDVPEGEIIYFTDCGWSKDGVFRRSEGLIKYIVPFGGLSAGTVITYTADQKNNNGFTTTRNRWLFRPCSKWRSIVSISGEF